mgnify:FL=1
MSDIRVPNKPSKRIPNVLTIAGTDPSGGAGIQADLKAFSAAGAYGMSVITAVVAQNTQGVRAFQALDPEFVFDQAAAVFEDVQVDAVKIGMVANAGIIEAITKALDQYTDKATCPVVLDPVMVAKSGDSLLDADTEGALREQLVPRSTLITPNLPEASVLLDLDAEMNSLDQMQENADKLLALGCDWVLLKGGHLEGHTSELSTDILIGPDTRIELTAPRIATTNDHGTGCTLSAAIAARLPRMDMESAVREAKDYLTAALKHADQLNVGHGHGPVHHFHNLWRNNA